MVNNLIAGLMLALLAFTPVRAEEPIATGVAPMSYQIPDTEVVDLPHSSNGGDYQLYVHVPPACRTEDRSCSVVYLLDAEYSFGVAAQIVTHLSDRSRIPPVISVGISNREKNHYRLFRTRDYTPYFVAEGGYGPQFQKFSGGGAAFLKVIQEEIIPYVESRYPAKPDERTLVGHSFGGLFATYVWTHKPEVFDNYLIVSPSIWYADEKILEEAAAACEESAGPARDVYLAVGSLEEQPAPAHHMVSELKHLNEILDHCKSREVSTYLRVFEDETHASIFPPALSTGLRKHFQ